MNIFLIACILFSIFSECGIAMQRRRENRDLLDDPRYDIFCEPSREKSWVFTNDNFPSFQEIMKERDVKPVLAKLSSLSFHNHIELSALDDESVDGEEWNDIYVFTFEYFSDLEGILQDVVNLTELSFYNVPSLVTHLNTPLPCANFLQVFCFDYDTNLFDASISLDDLGGLSQFTSLNRMRLHSGIFTFSEHDDIVRFFSPFTNLVTLQLHNTESDDEYEKVMRSLACLKKLDTLEISFIDREDFISISGLSPLNFEALLEQAQAIVPFPSDDDSELDGT